MRISEARRKKLYGVLYDAIMDLRIKSLKTQITERDLFDLQDILWKQVYEALGVSDYK